MLACSQAAKTASTASPASPVPMTRADDQPRTGASISDQSTRPSPAIDSSPPARSGAAAAGFLESGTSGTAHAKPAAAIGTLIRNTDPHQKCASSRPPMMGPSAMPTPLVPAHSPMARCRSPPSRNMSVMIDNVDGMISAAPMPMLARAAISIPTDPENAAQVDPAANAARPARKVRFRPTRSATLPATSSSPANTITYASTIHCSWLVVACRSRTRVGSTTLSTVLSSVTISSETHNTASASHRRVGGRRATGRAGGYVPVLAAMSPGHYRAGAPANGVGPRPRGHWSLVEGPTWPGTCWSARMS